ncbi:MAG TPA: glycosyl transferase [Paenibacillaceae bacterium]
MASSVSTMAHGVSFRHLERMTDDTGLLEHAMGCIPRREEGYTTDDNARALWACLEWLELLPPEDAGRRETLMRLADTYLSFLLWAAKKDGTFHNNFSYGRLPEAEEPSEDCHGRVLWALVLAAESWPDRRRGVVAETLLAAALPHAEAMRYPRGQSHALLALCRLLETAQRREAAGNGFFGARDAEFPSVRQLEEWARLLEERLSYAFRRHADEHWRWPEAAMTYANGTLPAALLAAYLRFGRRETGDIARQMLDFLIEKMSASEGGIRPIGNRGWCTRESCARWDQQPLEAMKLALACRYGWLAFGDFRYAETARACRAWFRGLNDAGVPLVDEDGGCCDGVGEDGPNFNRGAESTLAYLLTEAICLRMEREGAAAAGEPAALERVPD